MTAGEDDVPQDQRWRARLAIARRDLLEFVRDRRAVFITLVMPMAMYPLLALSSTLGIRTALTELDRRQPPSRLELALSGEDAPALAVRVAEVADHSGTRPADWPESLVLRIVDPTTAVELIDEGGADAWIDVTAGTALALEADATVSLAATLSTVRPANRNVKEHVAAVFRRVADQARVRRLHRLGLPHTLAEPLTVGFSGGVPPSSTSAMRDILPTAFAAVFVLLALLTATGAFYPAIDAIAGEKERGTIETLLIAPCAAVDIVHGKFLAVFAVTLATLLANVVSIALTATVLSRVLSSGLALGLDAGGIIACSAVTLAAYVGLAAVSAALCLAVTAAAKSAKEAQNTLTPVVMLIAALAAAAVLPGAESRSLLPAVPFAGQVAVAKSALADFGEQERSGDERKGRGTPSLPVALVVSLVSSALVTWLLLQLTATLLTDEEILFRGPDTAAGGFSRPAPRPLPTPAQGIAAALAGFAALWYAHGLAAREFVPAILTQQAVAVLVPLIAVACWQRVDGRRTFSLRWPGTGTPAAVAAVAGAALVGVGLFGTGAAAALAAWGTDVSAELRDLSARLVDLVRSGPAWRAVLLLAVLPAVCEELFFRGWMLAGFAGERPSRRRAVAAVVAQAGLFAAFHLLPERMPQTFLLGLALGWMTLATRSILPAVVAHAAHNATPVMFVAMAAPADLAAVEVGDAAGLPRWAVVAALACLAAGGMLLAVAARGRDARNP
jgi:sodium transport system permease protein